MKWKKFKARLKLSEEGLFLIRLDDGSFALGSFYCGEFVLESGQYNDTPGLAPHIIYYCEVHFP